MVMNTFKDLKFENRQNRQGEIQAVMLFDNGYGVSVIRTKGSYGFESGLYELAVLEGVAGKYLICYDTHITNDVIGHLTEHGVTKIMKQVQEL